jgi:hypothetical protein
MGLILVMFVRPPKLDKNNLLDLWSLILTVVLFGLFLMLVKIPLAQKFLKVAPLASKQDYQFIFIATGLWTILMVLFYTVERLGKKMKGKFNRE